MNYLDLIPASVSISRFDDAAIEQIVRLWRDSKLSSSDWTQLPDVDLANKWDWAVYRQQLRDMMAQSIDPKLIVFPEPPK